MKLSRQFTKREKVLLIILVVLMLAAGYFLAVWQPVTNAVSALETERMTVEDEILTLETLETSLEQMRTELEEALRDPNVAEIPTYNNLQQLTAFLNTTLDQADHYNLSFQTPQMPEVEQPADGAEQSVQPAQPSGIVRRQLSMTFTCPNYETARDIIAALHASPYRCQLGDLSLSPTQTAAPEGMAGANIETAPLQVNLSVTFFEAIR